MDQGLSSAEDLSPEEEYYLGRAVAANILKRYAPYQGNPELTAYLNQICGALVVNSPQPTWFNGYHLILLDTEEINAFATPGGHIFITRGLAEAVDSEDTLAAVIAHELAHIHRRHGAALIKDMRLTEDLSASADRVLRIAGRGASPEDPMRLLTGQIRELVNVLVVNGYSQAQEFEADAEALSLLASAGYTPASLIEVLQILERTQGTHPGGLNATHPPPALRIANAEKTLHQYLVPDTRSFRLDRYIPLTP
jgi:predicted Zn-dependent protease